MGRWARPERIEFDDRKCKLCNKIEDFKILPPPKQMGQAYVCMKNQTLPPPTHTHTLGVGYNVYYYETRQSSIKCKFVYFCYCIRPQKNKCIVRISSTIFVSLLKTVLIQIWPAVLTLFMLKSSQLSMKF